MHLDTLDRGMFTRPVVETHLALKGTEISNMQIEAMTRKNIVTDNVSLPEARGMKTIRRIRPWGLLLVLLAVNSLSYAQTTMAIRRAVLVDAELRADRSYQLEASSDGSNWTPIGDAVSGFTGLYSWCHPTEMTAFQLFRIVEGEALQPERVVPSIGLRMLEIPAGNFLMGSPAGELDRDPEEGPQTSVEITESFWMGKFEVTQSEWNALMPDNPSQFRGEALPVDSVSWEQALEFCRLLTEKEREAGRLEEGLVYRLPTEAEWEYACRAGTVSRFYWGEDPSLTEIVDYAWTAGNSNGETHEGGQRFGNGFGLHDMAGNVVEWVQDTFMEYSGGAEVDPVGPAVGETRVFRGGSWLFSGEFARSAARGALDPVDANAAIGFRVACAMDLGDTMLPSTGGPTGATWVVDFAPDADLLGDTIELARIEPGTFQMGSPESERFNRSDEKPVRQVTITEPYWIGVFELTQSQWTFVMGDDSQSSPAGPDHPVNFVDWNEARAFCREATQRLRAQGLLPDGYELGLPTEAQWEKAVRAGTTTSYFFGNSDVNLGDYAWFDDNTSPSLPQPVGGKEANPNGLYDVYGNVEEWCFDYYWRVQDSALIDPIGPDRVSWSDDEFVVKGGHYNGSSRQLRSAEREGERFGRALRQIGFRVAIRPVIAE